MTLEIPWWLPTLTAFLGIVMGYFAGFTIFKLSKNLQDTKADKDTRTLLLDAKREASHILREAKLQAKDEVLEASREFNREAEKRREQIRKQEERIALREHYLDNKMDALDKKESKLEVELASLDEQRDHLVKQSDRLRALVEEEQAVVQRVADLSRDEARKLILEKMEQDLNTEAAVLARKIQHDTREKAEQEARNIIIGAIQRYAADQAAEITTSAVQLAGDELKGRIIGREGRNIRTLEAVTGVDVLIDDTPEVVLLSSFDPIRREVAKVSLENLLADGRIQPARIEEEVQSVREDIEKIITEQGENALYELGLHGTDPEIIKLVGRLRYRQSYGQNVLEHSIETGHIMGMMAAELHLDITIAKRVGLFHDLGKALDHRVEGSHAKIGSEVLAKFGESSVVINAVAAHHGEIEPESPYAALAFAADAITASRPGARSETTAAYLKRLEKLEGIALGFQGVEKCFAVQAGREIRVLVEPSKLDDNQAMQLARNIAQHIESHLDYPGQIKVTVIRETRCVEYAR